MRRQRQGTAVGGAGALLRGLALHVQRRATEGLPSRSCQAPGALRPVSDIQFTAGPCVFLLRLLEEDGQGSEKCGSPPSSCQGEPCGQDLDRPS